MTWISLPKELWPQPLGPGTTPLFWTLQVSVFSFLQKSAHEINSESGQAQGLRQLSQRQRVTTATKKSCEWKINTWKIPEKAIAGWKKGFSKVFPNRIENDRNGNSSNCIRRPGPFAMQLALRLCFCLMPIASISTSSQKIRNAVVVSHVKIHPTRQSVKLARGKSERLRWDKNHCIRKSAATTWLQRTLGGVIVGLTTLWIARYNMGVCLVIQKSPEKIEMGKSLPHW